MSAPTAKKGDLVRGPCLGCGQPFDQPLKPGRPRVYCDRCTPDRRRVGHGGVREPRVRRDGRCVTCKRPRPEKAVKEGDPFCKTVCCREYYGLPVKAEGKTGS